MLERSSVEGFYGLFNLCFGDLIIEFVDDRFKVHEYVELILSDECVVHLKIVRDHAYLVAVDQFVHKFSFGDYLTCSQVCKVKLFEFFCPNGSLLI
jgi:hypothetical protein